MLLLFAAYENLLRSLSRSILESVQLSRARGRNLKPQLFALLLSPTVESTVASYSRRGSLRCSQQLVEKIDTFRTAELNPAIFPDDGTFMRQSQVDHFCAVFDLPHPGSTLGRIYGQIDRIVSMRNEIAHGDSTPAEVGRRITRAEAINLIDDWENAWIRFIEAAENRCNSTRHYFR